MASEESPLAEITIKVPAVLADRLADIQDRLPEILAHGMEELSPLPNEVYRAILAFLASTPSPEEIATFRPTPGVQERVRTQLDKNRAGQLTPTEAAELEEYERIEHCMRMLKIRALKNTSPDNATGS
jgi:hypothetical protein